MLGSLLEFKNGITAIEEISLLPARPRTQKKVAAATTRRAATPPAMIHVLRFFGAAAAGATACT